MEMQPIETGPGEEEEPYGGDEVCDYSDKFNAAHGFRPFISAFDTMAEERGRWAYVRYDGDGPCWTMRNIDTGALGGSICMTKPIKLPPSADTPRFADAKQWAAYVAAVGKGNAPPH